LARRIALALAVGLALTLFVIWRDADRADATYVIGATPATPLTAVDLKGVPRRTFALPRLVHDGRGRLLLQIATYVQKPSATVRLTVLDASGAAQARCTFRPSTYRDNALLPCDVPHVAHARRVVVAHAGTARIGVFAGTDGAIGYLAYTSPGDLVSRMRSVVNRIGVSLPPGVGPFVFIAGLWLSTAAVVLALLIVIGVARERPDPLLEEGEPLSEPAGVLAEPADDEREVQHDREEEAESDDEERVGRRDDAEGARDAGEQGGPGGEHDEGQPRG
jgi:hypothetical protein